MSVELQALYKGQKFTVIHCAGAIESFNQAIQGLGKNKRISMTAGMVSQIGRLADGHTMSFANFPQEGELPKRPGKPAKKFSALKRIPIRGYCWLSDIHPNTYFISHYVYKNWDKLADSDTNIVGKNWSRIEEQGNER